MKHKIHSQISTTYLTLVQLCIVSIAYLSSPFSYASEFNTQPHNTASKYKATATTHHQTYLDEANFQHYLPHTLPYSRVAASLFSQNKFSSTHPQEESLSRLDGYIYNRLNVIPGQYSRPLMNIYREHGTHLKLDVLNKLLQTRTAKGKAIGQVDTLTGLRAPSSKQFQEITYHYLDSDKIERRYGIRKVANDYPNVELNGIRILRVVNATQPNQSQAQTVQDCQANDRQQQILQRVNKLKDLVPDYSYLPDSSKITAQSPTNSALHDTLLDHHFSTATLNNEYLPQKNFFRHIANELVNALSSSYIVIKELNDHFEVKSFADCGAAFYITEAGFKVELPSIQASEEYVVIQHDFSEQLDIARRQN